jgi:hypothetical protein
VRALRIGDCFDPVTLAGAVGENNAVQPLYLVLPRLSPAAAKARVATCTDRALSQQERGISAMHLSERSYHQVGRNIVFSDIAAYSRAPTVRLDSSSI